MTKKEICPVCGGTLVKELIRYDKRFGEEVAIFEDVPAKVCPQCGEVWLEARIVEKMEKLFLNKTKPTHKMTIPVWRLGKAA